MTDFTLMTAADVLNEVEANAALKPDAIATLAHRVVRAKPRAPSVDAFCALVGLARYADVRTEGPEAYKAWVADAQAAASPLAGKPVAAPKARKSTKSTKARKTSAPKAKAAKRTSKPSASSAKIDRNAIAAAMGIEPKALDAMATFFKAL